MVDAWISALLAAATLAASDPAAPPLSRQDALARYGAPAARTALPRGGERIRWVKAEESMLAGLYVTTVEVDQQGKVLRLDRQVLHGPDRAGH